VRMRDRGQHVEEEANPRRNIECAPITIAIDVLALDALEYQVRFPTWAHAGVKQFGNIRVSQTAKNAALALESFLTTSADDRRTEKLDGDLPLEAPIVALG
jgi:hypothetical protein